MKHVKSFAGKRIIAVIVTLACLLTQGTAGLLSIGAAGEEAENILAGNTNVSGHYIEHKYSWQDTYPEYKPEDFDAKAFNMGLSDTIKASLTDGKLDAATPFFEKSPQDADIYDQRRAILYDLGGMYDLSKITLHLLEADTKENDYTDSRFIYSFSAYAGNKADGSLLNNLVGTGGGKEQAVSADLTCSAPVRYVLIVFNKHGGDPGNQTHLAWYQRQVEASQSDGRDTSKLGVPEDRKEQVGDGSTYRGAQYANGGIKLAEIGTVRWLC